MSSETKVYEKKPEDFSPKAEVAAIYVNVDGKLLFLELSSSKLEVGAWGVPAGKIEVGEKPEQAAKRELFEETGIDIDSEDLLQPLKVLYVRKPDTDYVYHLFGIHLNTQPSIHLSFEHTSYQWVSKEEAEKLPLMKGAKEALDVYYRLYQG